MWIDPLWVDVQRLRYAEMMEDAERERRFAHIGKKLGLAPLLSRLGDGFIAIGLRLKERYTVEATSPVPSSQHQLIRR